MIVNLEQIIDNLKIENKIDDKDFMFLKVCYVIYVYNMFCWNTNTLLLFVNSL